MYADDLVLLADSPGELQLMMDVITDYAKKWRFQINESKPRPWRCANDTQNPTSGNITGETHGIVAAK